jgi:hypothetical protein
MLTGCLFCVGNDFQLRIPFPAPLKTNGPAFKAGPFSFAILSSAVSLCAQNDVECEPGLEVKKPLVVLRLPVGALSLAR